MAPQGSAKSSGQRGGSDMNGSSVSPALLADRTTTSTPVSFSSREVDPGPQSTSSPLHFLHALRPMARNPYLTSGATTPPPASPDSVSVPVTIVDGKWTDEERKWLMEEMDGRDLKAEEGSCRPPAEWDEWNGEDAWQQKEEEDVILECEYDMECGIFHGGGDDDVRDVPCDSSIWEQQDEFSDEVYYDASDEPVAKMKPTKKSESTVHPRLASRRSAWNRCEIG